MWQPAFQPSRLLLAPNAQDNMGDAPLHDAARFGHDEVVQILLDAGTNCTLKNLARMNLREPAFA